MNNIQRYFDSIGENMYEINGKNVCKYNVYDPWQVKLNHRQTNTILDAIAIDGNANFVIQTANLIRLQPEENRKIIDDYNQSKERCVDNVTFKVWLENTRGCRERQVMEKYKLTDQQLSDAKNVAEREGKLLEKVIRNSILYSPVGKFDDEIKAKVTAEHDEKRCAKNKNVMANTQEKISQEPVKTAPPKLFSGKGGRAQ